MLDACLTFTQIFSTSICAMIIERFIIYLILKAEIESLQYRIAKNSPGGMIQYAQL